MRYHIPTLMKQVERDIKAGKQPSPETIRVLDAWWSAKQK